IEGKTGPDGKPTTVWRYPATAKPPDPIISITKGDGVRIRNVIFDGNNRADSLIDFSGNCPGVTLDRVVLQGFNQYGVRITNCAGPDSRPLLLSGVRFYSTAPAPPRAGVLFNAIENHAIKGDRFIRLENCRFEGAFAVGALEKTETTTLENVAV